MYRDEIWYRKWEEDVDEHREEFTEKQWRKFRMEQLVRSANRVRQYSDECETCKGYQETLTRLEEELQELPGSKAQRQWQKEQLQEMGAHFVEVHNVAPPNYYLRKWLKSGLIAGAVVGVIATIVVGNLLLFPVVFLGGGALAALYGWSEDQRIQREHRLV
jgi:hypothetical protein